MRVRLKSNKTIHKIVSRQPGVRKAVDDAAQKIKVKAEANLKAHRREGDAEIGIDTKGTDAVVYMTSPDESTKGGSAALAIEFGHKAPDGSYVPGLYPLTKAAGIT